MSPRVAAAGEGDSVDRRGTDATVESALSALGLDPADPLATVTADPPSLARSLAAAARRRGHDHPNDAEVARLRDELATLDDDRGSEGADGDEDGAGVAAALERARERAAEAARDVDRLRERVATLRGRLRERRDRDGDSTDGATEPPADLEAAFESATRELTEAETERVAAEQALSRAADRARRLRDARDRRRSLRDALANRRREARSALARRMGPPFADALASPPAARAASPDLREEPTAFDGDPVVGHLAAVETADRDEPVVVSAAALPADPAPATVAERLCAPVVLVD
ncbi:hypothetical protein [Halobaculum litoreum]|uniref:Uncharacterized protein n=1 Tax=Halobaculum litoreum TaxID=3031998 RepID=A0ABD5XLP5_9EURY|nr:hypothetical protein [Halobaculum sp. DT92]